MHSVVEGFSIGGWEGRRGGGKLLCGYVNGLRSMSGLIRVGEVDCGGCMIFVFRGVVFAGDKSWWGRREEKEIGFTPTSASM